MSVFLEMSRAVEARDPFSAGHAARVSVFAEVVAARLGLDEDQIEIVRVGAALHDIGKLAISTEVLTKAGPLTDEQLEEIRAHPEAGARMLELVKPLRRAISCVRHHHERWDGAGYPDGFAGEEIPLEARILAVADAFDAMTSDRPYREALAVEHAIEELVRCAGAQFDPDVVTVFVEAWQDGAFEIEVAAGIRAAAS